MPQIRLILNINGLLLLLLSLFMPLGIGFSLYYGDHDISALLEASLLTALCGGSLWIVTGAWKNDFNQIRKRDGYVIVFLGWVAISCFGTLPYLLYGSISNFTDAFFETISGFTTTGASVLNDIESIPHGILFWRSMTHWLGGMGIIVLTLAILPILGVGGAQLFGAESAGPQTDKIHPHVQGTAKRLWGIYAVLTLLETMFLLAGGMNLFDALCHSFATISTGGFSTRQDSLAAYPSPYIHYIVIVFMILGGTNFALLHHAIHAKWELIKKDEELRFYAIVVSIAVLFTSVAIYLHTSAGVEKSFRDAAFQVVSIVTSTGFVSADYEKWAPFTPLLFLLLMFSGACVGSTSGAIKMMRVLVLLKAGFLELKRILHPTAVLPIRLNGKVVPPQTMKNIYSFFFLYIVVFVVSSFFMSFEPAFARSPLSSALSAVATSMGGVGPGLGAVGPVNNFAALSVSGKWLLSFLMLLGRLEIFTIFVTFLPSFWIA